MELKDLLDKYKLYAPGGDVSVLEKAYAFSEKAHSSQNRASGERYFVHCYFVADTLLDYKLDIATIAAGLLHDVLEDTPTEPQTLKKEFGDEISGMVLAVTKIDRLVFSSHDEETAENWRKMLLATAQDVRVILIKLADRLHNMRTLDFLPRQRQELIAAETINLYAPLAQRFGMFHLKAELEDLSFKAINPQEHAELSKKVAAQFSKGQTALETFKSELEKHLSSTGIAHRVLARTKNLYSIYRKMQSQKREFEEIQDSLGIRIITDTVQNCYALLGIVHSTFKPVAGSFTDYIALPKLNLYQSLHTTVVSPAGDVVEIQIRTEEMHRTSEYGIAAHWRYKLGGGADEHFEEKLNWLRQWIEWLQDLTSPREFLESFKTDLELLQVFIFTPKGEVKVLPKGATPLDFAYAVHTQVGEGYFGARINGKIVSLDYELKSGEICEILTRKNSSPKQDWLKVVKTARARSKIKKYLADKAEEK
ncbi:MAG: RelA/SpoT family protein [Elusimicrobia bacterium]|nr:RelA/SpoT family protein [Elusimicrobiota bacterium]